MSLEHFQVKCSFGLLITFFVNLSLVTGYNITDIQRLKKALLVDQEYDKSIRPVINQSKVMEINISFSAKSLLDFNLVNGRLGASGLLYATWYDEQLFWNPADFGGIQSVQLSMDTVWTPGLRNAFDLEGSFAIPRVVVYADGRVTWLPASVFYSICSVDITYYPYDEHTCEFPIFSSIGDDSTIVFVPLTETANIDGFTKHGEWEVFASKSVVIRHPDFSIDLYVSYFVTSLRLRRRPRFAILHTYFPLLLLCLLNGLTFLVPLDKGERVSFSITLLLALIFFTASTTATLPQNSLNTSYFSSTVTLAICASGLGVMFNVLLVRLAEENERPIPYVIQVLTRFIKGGHLRNSWVWPRKNAVVALQNENGEEDDDKSKGDGKTEHEGVDKNAVTWQDVAGALNTFLHVVYCFALFIGVVVLVVLHHMQ